VTCSGDILLVLLSALTVADISVVHRQRVLTMRAAAATAGSAAALRDREKARYERGHGLRLCALSVESRMAAWACLRCSC
jgi:hypothetical protein